MIRYRPLSTRPIWSVMRDMTTEGGYPVGQTGPDMAEPLPDERVPWTLRAAAGVVSIEALVEGVAVTGRTAFTPGLRVMLVLCLALKWLFAWRVLRLHPGAAFGLLLLEGTTVVSAFGAVDTDAIVRLALGGTALTVVVLVLASLHAFPPPAMPKA